MSSLSPSSVALGDVLVGTDRSITLTLSGEGRYRLTSPPSVTPASQTIELTQLNGVTLISLKYTASGAARSYTGSVRVERLDDGDAVVETLTAAITATDVATAEEAAVEIETGDVSGDALGATLNRYTVHVPTHNTTMVLGRGSTRPATLHGFGIRTDEKFYVRADKNLVMQSGGDALMQSKNESLFAVAKKDLTAAGAGSANLLSPGGVMISGGFGSLSPQDQDGTRDSESDVLMVSSLDGLSSAASTAGTVLAALDATVAGMSAIYGAIGTVQAAIDVKKKVSATTIAGAVTAGLGTAAATAGAFCSGFSAGGALPWGGTTIVGSSGVAIGSPGFSGFYSLLGLVNVSLYPAILGLDPFFFAGNGLTMRALNSVDIHGVREAHINSMKTTRVTAGKKVSMEALEISIGKDATPIPKTKTVSIKTLDPGTSIDVDGAMKKVKILATQSFLMDAGPGAFGIYADATGVVRVGSKAQAQLELNKMDMTLYANALQLKTAAGDSIKAGTGSLKFTAGKIDLN